MRADHIHLAVILARGLGKRMRKADQSAAIDKEQGKAADLGMKGMIPIGRPFLDYVLSALADAGIQKVCLVIGPEHTAVIDHYMKESKPTRLEVEFAFQDKPLGTADALLAAEQFCGQQPFIVLNSDNYYPAAALTELASTTAPAIAAFSRRALMEEGNVPAEKVVRFGAVSSDESGFLKRIVPRPGEQIEASQIAYASMNCWSFDYRIFDVCRQVEMSPRGELELPRAVQLAVDERGMKMRVLKFDLPVLDMSTRGDIASMSEKLAGLNVKL